MLQIHPDVKNIAQVLRHKIEEEQLLLWSMFLSDTLNNLLNTDESAQLHATLSTPTLFQHQGKLS